MSTFLAKLPVEIQEGVIGGTKEMVGSLLCHVAGQPDEQATDDIAKVIAEHIAQLICEEAESKLGTAALDLSLHDLARRAANMRQWADDIMANVRRKNVARRFPTPLDFDDSDTTPVPGDDDDDNA